ncbi:MFS transporter [Micromonospora sp. PLK6-60]|uniref:MFS transporter n=1 Tax=Micromonospora sp. PLK6-60 TaxID=2873383 RepID=UPI001CA7782E|nr:MFS transporter [Micromonospora sp. PLK6-60]MBY8875059.1 MFS transporter [Micromonospora sp. PLK6-60]
MAALPAPLRTLFVTTLIFRAGTVAYPFLAAYLLLAGVIGPTAVGTALACFGVGALAADLAATVLLARFGARSVILAGLLLNAAVVVVVPWSDHLASLIVALLVWGFAYEVVTPASYSAVVAQTGAGDRKVPFSCIRLAINLGIAVGPLVGALVFAVQPRLVFWVNSACVLAAAGYLWTRPAAAAPGGAPRPAHRTRAPRLGPPARARFWTIYGLSLPVQLAYSLPSVFVATYVIVVLDLPGYWAGVVFSVNALCIVLFEVPVNVLMTRVSNRATLRLGYGLAGAGFLLMSQSESGPALILSTLVWTAGEMVVFPGLLNYVSSLSPGPSADRSMSIYSTGVNVAFILAPQLALLLSRPAAPALPWAAAGAAVVVAWLILIVASKHPYTWHPEEEPCRSAT